ncbi:hypothetical protein Pint_26096 [Pistacia integerrima]|uniref:Uncharacterized protein n=1 Tax=Pistacia integerrima TaxID=434235 RepID=A0ACC0YDA3_9ROSI|nr:hypothetical protein Pint_26096 [Pistacia integerrima]
MEETVGSSALQSCTDLIGDQFSLLYNYKTNFENLRAQVEKLTLVRQRVQHKILGAERIGKKNAPPPKIGVPRWVGWIFWTRGEGKLGVMRFVFVIREMDP